MKVLATYNLKGGVGKTASAVNLSYLAARQGYQTLLWDLDPQAAATYYFRIEPRIKGGAKRLISGKRALEQQVRGSDFEGLDLLPGDFSCRHLDLAIERSGAGAMELLLAPLRERYDLLLFDCPTGASLLAEAVFDAADLLLVPMVPTTLSLRTLARLREHLQDRPSSPTIRPFFSMVDQRRKLHRQITEAARGGQVAFFEQQIPLSSAVENMGLKRAPLVSYDRRGQAAKAYEGLWREVEHLIFGEIPVEGEG